MSENKALLSGVSFFHLLGLLFIALKLTGAITWSWWWVTIPFWGPLAAVIILVIFAFSLAGIITLFTKDER